jgi:hypothetical protein
VTTGPLGIFASTFTAPEIAGPVTINLQGPVTANGLVTASATTRVHPRIDSLVQPRGAVTGGVSTVVNGLGFDASTQVSFGGRPAVLGPVAPDHASAIVTTPASPGVGPVAVMASVNNISSSPSQYDYIEAGVPVMEFVDASGSPMTSHTCNVGHIRVQIFNADGTPRTGTVLLSATYSAFWEQVGHRWRPSNSISAALGSVVPISGGGPITAADATNPANKTTAGFPVWPPDLCSLVKAVDKKASQILLTRAAQLYAFEPSCEGDCRGAGPAVVIWGDAQDLTKARNYVFISGKSADEIKASYKVDTLANEARDKLIIDNPFVAIHAKAEGRAAFVGPMISIEITRTADTTADAVSGARVSFALPDRVGTYGIVHLRLVGDRQAWIEEKLGKVLRGRTTMETDVESPGVYALVRIVSTAAESAAAATKSRDRQ